MRVKSKSTIVPDPASGNGKEIAIIFARDCAKLALPDVDPKAADAAASEINPTGQHVVGALYVHLDRTLGSMS